MELEFVNAQKKDSESQKQDGSLNDEWFQKKIVTTGDVARLCEVSSQTVIRWSNVYKDELKPFRVATGGRKFLFGNVFSFLKQYKFVGSIQELYAMLEVKNADKKRARIK